MRVAKVAAVILTWNNLSNICSLIEDTQKLDLQNIHLDIYVVDNDSTNGTPAYLKHHYSQVKLLNTGKNLGSSGEFSYGMQLVSQMEYDYIWLLQDDVCLHHQSLIYLVQTLRERSEVGVVGSQIRKLQQPNTIQEIGRFINSATGDLIRNFNNSSVRSPEFILRGKPYISVDACSATSLLVRRELIQIIGGFEDYFLHFDDVEWCLRVKQANWIVAINPASIIWHHSPDFKCRAWINYYNARNLSYCLQKHYPELLLKRVIASLPRLLYYAATGRYFLAEMTIAGFQDFLKGVRGQMPDRLNYPEYTLAEIINKQAHVLVQSHIYQDSLQSRVLHRMESEQKIAFWHTPKSLAVRMWLTLVTVFWKPIDIALISCQNPDFYAFTLAKKVYYFTGNSYVPVSTQPLTLLKAVSKTFWEMWQIYWQIRKLKLAPKPRLISTHLSATEALRN